MMKNTILLHANFHWSAYHVLAALKLSHFVVQCSISSVKILILMLRIFKGRSQIFDIHWFAAMKRLVLFQVGRLEIIIIQNYTKFLIFIVHCSKLHTSTRVEICRDRHDRWACKICASCVNFPRKQRNFSHNLRRTSRFTHTKCDFALKQLRFYTLS